jgi:hypothetical protein
MSKVRGSVLASAMMIAGLSLVLAVTQAQAQQTTPPATRIGDATRSLLELQRDGRAAAPAQPARRRAPRTRAI